MDGTLLGRGDNGGESDTEDVAERERVEGEGEGGHF